MLTSYVCESKSQGHNLVFISELLAGEIHSKSYRPLYVIMSD